VGQWDVLIYSRCLKVAIRCGKKFFVLQVRDKYEVGIATSWLHIASITLHVVVDFNHMLHENFNVRSRCTVSVDLSGYLFPFFDSVIILIAKGCQQTFMLS